MTRVILDPYSSFRDKDFKAVVIAMGIKEFGEGEKITEKAFIEFDDGGAPITYLLDIKGKSMVEAEENGRAKIKNFQVGAFAEQVKKFGYETFIDTDPDSYEFGTIPSLEGVETTWKAEKGRERIDENGAKKDGFTNFVLIGISGKQAGTEPQKSSQKTTPPPSKPDNKPTTKPGEIDTATMSAWKDFLTTELLEPMTAGDIQKKINELTKACPSGDAMKATYAAMSKVRPTALKALVAEKFLAMDENQKYSLVN